MFRTIWLARLAAAISLLTCSACASIISDNESTTYFATTPEHARCELHGQDFTRVVETPGSMVLPADAAPVTVACTAEGYRTTTALLDTSADGWVVGNALFGLLGGPIGLIIDASRGAGQQYPPQFALVLEPSSFPSLAERDAWYDRRRSEIEASWAETIESVQQTCRRNNAQPSCKNRLSVLEKKRDDELASLEERRNTATVVASQ